MKYHWEEKRLEFGINSYVFWAKKPEGKALVFIHGFNGGPYTTFKQFDVLLRNYKEFAGCDIFFYGYSASKSQIAALAKGFVKMLLVLEKECVELYNKSFKRVVLNPRNSNFKYDNIVIVAHSLGAILTRIALIEINKSDSELTKKFDMILYAPAHFGAHLSETYAILPLGILNLLASFKLGVKNSNDLRPSSKLIAKLLNDTKAIQSGKNYQFTIAKAVFWAEVEKVVIQQDYLLDKPAIVIEKTNHQTVCKPKTDNCDQFYLFKKAY
jgi:hypothetical protein